MKKLKNWLSGIKKILGVSPKTSNDLTDWGIWGEVNNGRPTEAPMGTWTVNQYALTSDQLDKLNAYKELSDNDKSGI